VADKRTARQFTGIGECRECQLFLQIVKRSVKNLDENGSRRLTSPPGIEPVGMFRPQIESFTATGAYVNIFSIGFRLWIVVLVLVLPLGILFDTYGITTKRATDNAAAEFVPNHGCPLSDLVD
jgi:hypothetical protein